MGIPYDEAPDGHVRLDPTFGPRDFVVVCVGGNDFALRDTVVPEDILKAVKEIIKIYKRKGVSPNRMVYVTPSPPTPKMLERAEKQETGDLNALYRQFVDGAKEMCTEEGIDCVPLDHFTYKERSDTAFIPTPTPHGAKVLAGLIRKCILDAIEKEHEDIRVTIV